MIEITLTYLRLALRQRSHWLSLAFSAAAWPLALLFSPLAGSLSDTRATSLAKEVAFVCVLASLVLAEKKQADYGWLGVRLSQLQRLFAGFATRTLLGLCAGCLALLPATLLGGRLGLDSYLKLAFCSAHLAALYLLLQPVCFRANARSVLVLFLALAVPASVQGEPGPLRALQSLLDPRVLNFSAAPIWTVSGVQVASIGTLLLFSTLVGARRAC